MGEVIGLASGVAGLVAISLQISQLSYGYISDIINAPRTQKAYLQEVLALSEVLFRLEVAVQDSESAGSWLEPAPALSKPVVLECKQQLALQKDKLEQNRHRLAWPFHEREIKKAIDEIHRFRGIFANFLNVNTSITVSATFHHVSTIKQDHDRNQLLEWLRVPPESLKQVPDPLPGTGSWFFSQSSFQEWRTGPSSVLWCYGPPGAGKSSLALLVADHLSDNPLGDKVCVVRFFADFFRRKQQTETLILQAFLRQAIEQADPDLIPDLTRRRNDLGSSPKPTDLASIFSDLCRKQKTYLIFDAADEVENPKPLIAHFRTFIKAGCYVIVTSRDHPDIRALLSNPQHIQIQHIQILADTKDLVAYVQSRFEESDFGGLPGVQNSLVDTIVQRADGLFLLAKLIVDQLLDLPTLKKMRQALTSLPTHLDEAFESSLQRIDSQPKMLRELAHRAIQWAVYAMRPFRSTELAHAFAIEPSDDELDEEGIVRIPTVLRACAGLLVLDESDDTLTLVHMSAYEFFSVRKSQAAAEAHEDIARACLTYLHFRPLQAGPCTTLSQMNERLQELPFLDYAAHYWGKHATFEDTKKDVEKELGGLIYKILDNSNLLASSCQALHHRPSIEDQDIASATFDTLPKDQSRLHIVSFWGLRCTVTKLLNTGESSDSIDSQQWTPLHWATSNGHLAVMKLLLDASAKVEATDSQGWTPLFWANLKGNLSALQLLLDYGANSSAKDVHGWSPLRWAVATRHSNMIEALQKAHARRMKEGLGIDATSEPLPQDERYGLPDGKSVVELVAELEDGELFDHLLTKCASNETALKDLWSQGRLDPPMSNFWRILNKAEAFRGVQIPSPFGDNGRDESAAERGVRWKSLLLISAIKDEKLPVVKLLLQTGADVNYEQFRPALNIAAFRQDPEYVRILLKHGADHSIKDQYGQSALHQAVLNGFEETITALLDGGSDVNARRPSTGIRNSGSRQWGLAWGQTPIMIACGYRTTNEEKSKRQAHIINLLLQHGADLSLRDDNNKSCLRYAAIGGQLGLAIKAVHSGVGVNSGDDDGVTPLHSAVRTLNTELVQLLLDNGADFRAVDNSGRNAIHHLAESPTSKATMAELRSIFDLIYPGQELGMLKLEYDAYKARGLISTSSCMQYQTAMSMAIEKCNWNLFSILHESNAGFPRLISPLLPKAVSDFKPALLRLLFAEGAKLEDGKGNDWHSDHAVSSYLAYPLERLISRGLTSSNVELFGEMVEILVVAGLDITQTSNLSFLMLAARHCNLGSVPEIFLRNGAKPFYATKHGMDAFLTAAIWGNLEFLKSLLAGTLDTVPLDHWLQWLAKDGRSLVESDVLESTCTSLSEANKLDLPLDDKSHTLLVLAIEGGNQDLVKKLVAHGANVEVADSHGWRPLHWAAFKKDEVMIKCLLDDGRADANATTVCWASQWTKPSGLYADLTDTWTGTALHIATLLANPEAIGCLLKHGADVNASSGSQMQSFNSLHGPTALRIGLGEGHSYGLSSDLGKERLQIARMLIEHGAEAGCAADHLNWGQVYTHFKGFEDVWKHVQAATAALRAQEEEEEPDEKEGDQ